MVSTIDSPNLTIDPEFQKQLFPLSAVEFAHLEHSIITHGCREKLVVWNGLLLDGHNRYDICSRNGIPFEVREIDLPNREAAEDWIDRNQAGRRNLSPDQFAIVSGRIYNRRKKQGARSDLTSPQFDGKLTTAETVAAELQVSKATIERNGQRAEVFDRMQELSDEQASEAAKTAPQRIITEVKNLPADEAAETLKRHVHVSANSGCQEWYTPPEILDAARKVLGGIDTDPASSNTAQTLVQAGAYYDRDIDGLTQTWNGRVWLNPPYSNGLVDRFAEKLLEELDSGRTKSAIALVNNATETKWFQSLLQRASAVCFVRGRIKFLGVDLQPRKSPLQGQAILYFGERPNPFTKTFSVFGTCLSQKTKANVAHHAEGLV